ALAGRVRVPDAIGVLRVALVAMGGPAGRAVRPGRAQVLPFRAGAVAARRRVPGRAAGDIRAGPVSVHRRGRAPVLRIRLPANGLYRNLHVDRAQGRRRPPGSHPPGRISLDGAQAAPEAHQARALDTGGMVDGLYLHRLLRAHPRPGPRSAYPAIGAVAMVLDAVL